MTLILVGLASFLVGVAVGITLNEARAIAHGGHTGIMRSAATSVDHFLSTTPARYLGVAAVAIALAASAAAGFLSIATTASQDDLVACVVESDRIDSEARAAISAQATEERAARRILWRALKSELAGDSVDRIRMGRAIERYLDELAALDAAVISNPPTDPARCNPNGEEIAP